MRIPVAVLALVSLSLLACSAVDDVATSEAANTEGRPLTTLEGREWGRCWFDVAGDEATLSCRSTERAADDPLAATMAVSAVGQNSLPGQGFEGFGKTLDLEAGGTVVVGTFRRASFPVTLRLSAELTREASELIGDRDQTDFQTVPQIDRPEDLPASAPAILKQPFDLWPAAFIDGSDQDGRFVITASEYTRSIAPLSSHSGETEMTLRPWVGGNDAKGKIHYFVAPAEGAIEATLQFGDGQFPSSLDRAGYYTVTSSGLRPATPEEIAADFPSGGTPDGGGPSIDGDDDEPSEPPAPIDPDPT